MKRISGDGAGGKGVTWIPQNGYENVLIFFHGLGDTALGWSALMPSFALEKTKFILPTASSLSVSLNNGVKMHAWSDIKGLDSSFDEDAAGLGKSAERANFIIQKEIDSGIESNRIIVGGFAQGGALALHIALRSPHQLGGVIALSAWLPLKAEYPMKLSSAAIHLPVLQIHGEVDDVVSYEWGNTGYNCLVEMLTEPSPQFIAIPNLAHLCDEQEMERVKEFLEERFVSSTTSN